ncbi:MULTISPECIES: YbaN family protein [unclassified Treponema]|uniref:YbaN family protein n=1 Tax=unclassified Treponema TaxID=2638727 RepID=UPI0020A5840B|nr:MULTISPECIES: YbaN family protein [unclassified Treponema]UTC66033.1 YbaN family protein [Treponema sp. OMZ 789]UTC68763.1 YbaN family protein [Treponema sp. OMZ 790]UTC71492.1 YbaN family protein [Treponema sp. OMZ 791]
MKIMNIFWITIGFICLGLGILGIIMPLLPTTPFFLLTVFCFAKGSEKLKIWFMGTSFHKKYIQSFYEKKGMPLKNKIIILSFASIMLAVAFYFSAKLHARILIACVIAAKYYVFIFKIKTIPADERSAIKADAGCVEKG